MSEATGFPLALEPPETRLTAITAEHVSRAVEMSRKSPRGRIILPFHKSDDAPLHRMLNAMQPGSYVRPHRHLDPPKTESAVVLAGRIGYISFDEAGEVTKTIIAGPGLETIGTDTEPGVFHTFIALAPDTVIFEVKEGPYVRTTGKDFAHWAPEEGAAGAAGYLASLERLFA